MSSNDKVGELLLNASLLVFSIALMKLGSDSDRHKQRLDALEDAHNQRAFDDIERDYQAAKKVSETPPRATPRARKATSSAKLTTVK